MGLAEIFDPGDIFSTQQNARARAAKDAVDEALGYAKDAVSQNKSLYQDYLNRVNQNYGNEAGKYGDRVSALEKTEVYNPGQFGDNYNKSVEDFYSKFANQRKQQAMDSITNSMANAGNMFSSDYTDALAAKQQALASEEWDKAFEKYQQDRSQALNEFATNANLQNQAYQNTYNKNKDLLGLSQNALDNTTNAYGNYISNLANQNNSLAQSYMNAANAKAQIDNSKKGLLGRIFGSFIFGILGLGPVLTNLI